MKQEIICSNCGQVLKYHKRVIANVSGVQGGYVIIYVEPCPKCCTREERE
jgi:hypothetical protein